MDLDKTSFFGLELILCTVSETSVMKRRKCTQNFQLERGARQGYPTLALFVYLSVRNIISVFKNEL